MRIPPQTTIVLLLSLLPGMGGIAVAQEAAQGPAQPAEADHDWANFDFNTLDFKKKDPVKVQIEAAQADMAAAQKFLETGEKAKAVAAQQSALHHLLKARALKKDDKKDGKPKKGKDKKNEKKPEPPPTLADALETFAQGQTSLARRIEGRPAKDGERAEHHGLTAALDTLAQAAQQDTKLSRAIREAFGALQARGHAADTAIVGGAADGADRALAEAADARALAAMIHTANDRDLAKQLDQMRQQLEDAAKQLEKEAKPQNGGKNGAQKPGANGGKSKAQGNDAKDGGQSKGDGQSKEGGDSKSDSKGDSKSDSKGDSKPDSERSRREAARKVAEVAKQLDAVKAADRGGLHALKESLAQSKAGETLKHLAEEIPQAGSKQEDAKHAKELRNAAKAMAKAAETLDRNDAEKVASALGQLERAGKQPSGKPGDKPGDTPGSAPGKDGKPGKTGGQAGGGGEPGPPKKSQSELVKEAAASLADAKDASLRGIGGYLAAVQAKEETIPADRLAMIRAALLRKLRELRTTELDHAKDAPIPGEAAPVSEAYLRALADDLDHPGE